MSFQPKYSIEDIEAWIGCSDAHGEQIWTRSGLYNALCSIFAAEYSSSEARDQYQHVYDFGTVSLWETIERLKRNDDEKYFGYFRDTEHFFRYFRRSMKGKYLNDHKKTEQTVFYEENDMEHVVSTEEFEDNWLFGHQLDHMLEQAAKLLESFSAWIESTRASSVKQHFAELCNIDFEYRDIVIIGFMESGTNSDVFREHFKQCSSFKENTYKSNNRRLKQLWQKYIETEQGCMLYQAYKGLVQP